MPNTTPPDDLSRLERVLAVSPRARSPLFRWLLDHFDEVQRLVRRYGKNWTAMAAGLTEIGVTRRNGTPVSPDSLRKTWKQVHALETARRKDEAAVARRLLSKEPPGEAAPSPPPAPSSEPEFKPARLRSGYRSMAAPSTSPSGDDRTSRNEPAGNNPHAAPYGNGHGNRKGNG
jgi:hypothetical protein